MIDQPQRLRLSEALAGLAKGSITNYQFIDLCDELESSDPAIPAICFHFGELLTDDREYRLVQTDALDAENRAILERCCRFLQTDLEYEWPNVPDTVVLALVGGAAVFLILPFAVVLLIAALAFRDFKLLLAGLACGGLSALLCWCWSHRDRLPEWKVYWSNGDREAWPFLRQTQLSGYAHSGKLSDG